MTQNFIFARNVILDPDTGKILAVVRNGGVWRDGFRIAVLVGAHMYDLNGNLLGKIAAGDESLPISFKNLAADKSAQAERGITSRWSDRTGWTTWVWLEELKDQGVDLHLIDLGGSVIANGVSKMVFTILAAVAEGERDRLRERIRDAKRHLASQGSSAAASGLSASTSSLTATSAVLFRIQSRCP